MDPISQNYPSLQSRTIVVSLILNQRDQYFDRIVQMRGDKVYPSQSFAFMILERRLDQIQG